MNDLSLRDDQQTSVAISPSDLIFNADRMHQMVSMADMMAKAGITMPKHLQGKPSDCLAIVMQAAQWEMNPFAVAQKTHVVNGTLGYEAQLVNAVVSKSRLISSAFSYEYSGEGKDLRCRVGAVLRGETAITWGEWLRNGDVTTRNSPLWNTNPKQQLGYLQVKNWARLYCPGAILGVYTADELEDGAGGQSVVESRGPRRKSEPRVLTDVQDVASTERVDQQTGEIQPAAAADAPTQTAATAAPPPSARKTAATGGNLQAGQVAYLRNKLTAAGVSEQTICDRFQVTGIELLDTAEFDEIKAELLAMA